MELTRGEVLQFIGEVVWESLRLKKTVDELVARNEQLENELKALQEKYSPATTTNNEV